MEQFKHPGIRALPTALRGAVTGGWYEGSVFFAILGTSTAPPPPFPPSWLLDGRVGYIQWTCLTSTGILNYKWAQTGLLDGADKAIASLITSLCVGFGVNYWRTGDRPTAVILSAVGILQAVGARGASV